MRRWRDAQHVDCLSTWSPFKSRGPTLVVGLELKEMGPGRAAMSTVVRPSETVKDRRDMGVVRR